MLYTLLSWLVIGISAFLWGFGILFILGKINHYHSKTLDLVIMIGLCGLTVYAQFFSLFYKVGRVAVAGVLFLDVIWLFLIYKELINWIKEIEKPLLPLQLMVVVGIGILVLISTSGEVRAYDTYLYHAQSIRWLEEYGVVPGLGNLHSRLAYNSSSLCLQALFSFSFLAGQSMHSVNGFVIWILLSYAVCSMKFMRNKKIYASDFTRLALLGYYADKVYEASSPGTDLFAIGLIGYIVCKWVTLLEEDEEKVAPYAYLCILEVYAVSLKVSAAMIVFLVIMPAYRLIKGKKWGEIILYLSLGVLTIAPFLIRNVILSGYLLFPYPDLDLFSFDWKIPVSNATYEQTLIKAWAQGYRGQYKADAPFTEWFPLWRDSCLLTDPLLVIEFIADIVAIPLAMIVGVLKGFRKKNWNFFHITCCLTAGILFWFFNSPTRRFGETYLLLLPLYLAGSILENFKFKTVAAITTTAAFVAIGGFSIKYWVSGAVNSVNSASQSYLVNCAKYKEYGCQLANIGELDVYYPVPGTDLTGYYFFPATPYVSVLDVIELRGESFAEGFRPRERD